MKVAATGMLVVAAVVFIAARTWQDQYPWLGYVRAFAEAAMVGGLADWFAVTALFRHPLGIPIPHTAIIPRNKDRIGDTLASFLRQNFLTPRIVARRLEAFDMAAAAGRWLSAPSRSGTPRRGVAKLTQQVMEALDNESIGGLVRNMAANRIRAMEVSPMLGSAVDAAIEGNRHEPLIDAVIQWAARALDANEFMIREAVHQRTTWLLRVANVDETIADKIIDAIRNLIYEVAGDPHHPMRGKVTQGLRDFAFDLKHLPETRERVETIKNELLDHPEVAKYLGGLWLSLKTAILRAVNDPDAALAGRLGEAAKRLGETLEADPKLRAAVNLYARRAIVGIVAEYGDELVRIVSDTVRSWDARTITDRVENAVGRDLQYIRINGTLIGGLVGLTIHTASELL
ncbi:DUF445 domain-containing protein [Sphingoaurantiacus capsulatus]|uniref:DUF445 domain-containing protein n=1 Tax=Sphingoaurantiacus capsulatus TaxID=1771310 RepID=A0ABV7XBK4_9SPHN